MKKILLSIVAASAVGLAACSHSAGNAVPAAGTQGPSMAQNTATTQASQKQAMLDQEKVVAASAWRAPKHPGFLPPQAGPEEHTMGISDRGLPGGANAFSNRYDYRDASGNYVTVLAGARKSDGTGIVTIVNRAPDWSTVSTHTYSVAPGAVKIASAERGVVQLQSLVGGTRIPFDVNAIGQ